MTYIPTPAQVDELHKKIAPSQAAYNLIHTHCVVIATITEQLVRRQNALFVRRCTLPADAAELGGRSVRKGDGKDGDARGSVASARPAQMPVPGPALSRPGAAWDSVPPTDGVTGGVVPPRLLDENLAVTGAMVHDIGTYLVLRHDGRDGEPLKFDGPNYILHGLRGYDWLIAQGVDESIAQFARNHTGVGLTREQVVAQNLPLPPADYVPMNLEQEVVMVADKYNSKSIPPRFLTAQAYARKASRYGEANRQAWSDLVHKYGIPDVPALAARFHMNLER